MEDTGEVLLYKAIIRYQVQMTIELTSKGAEKCDQSGNSEVTRIYDMPGK